MGRFSSPSLFSQICFLAFLLKQTPDGNTHRLSLFEDLPFETKWDTSWLPDHLSQQAMSPPQPCFLQLQKFTSSDDRGHPKADLMTCQSLSLQHFQTLQLRERPTKTSSPQPRKKHRTTCILHLNSGSERPSGSAKCRLGPGAGNTQLPRKSGNTFTCCDAIRCHILTWCNQRIYNTEINYLLSKKCYAGPLLNSSLLDPLVFDDLNSVNCDNEWAYPCSDEAKLMITFKKP